MFKGFRVREKLAIVVLGLVAPELSHAITVLKQVQVSNGSQIDLLFDGKVQPGQIKTEFVGDVIQLNIQDVSVYPAKISSVNGGSLTKIFAYQYAPKLVRCRFTVKGKAEDYRNRLEVKPSGRILTVRMQGDAGPKAAVESSQKEEYRDSDVADAEERALLTRVMAARPDITSKTAPVARIAPQKATNGQTNSQTHSKDAITVSSSAPASTPAANGGGAPSTENLPILLTGENQRLGGAKPLPSPFAAFGKMAIVLAIFGGLAFGLKWLARNKAESRLSGAAMLAGAQRGAKVAVQGGVEGGWLGALGRIAKKGLGRQGRMIEVLSTHHLGPKKSIAVVRVGGRVLVLGVSNESINLITQLSGEDAAAQMEAAVVDGLGLDLGIGLEAAVEPPRAEPRMSRDAPRASAGVSAAGNSAFADLLTAERTKPRMPMSGASAYAAANAMPASKTEDSVRAKIRNRLEGLKPL